VKLALRALLVVAVAAVVAQTGAAAPARMHLVTLPDSFVMWNQHDGLLGVGSCDVADDINEGKCVSGAVERTSNGGRTYRVVLRTGQPIYELQTVGPFGAIASTYEDGSRNWRTLDGGRTWQRVSSKPAVDWLNPRMGIRFHSYVVGNLGELAMLVTHDGGHSWKRLHDPCRKAISFNAIADLVSRKVWWVACLGQGGAGNEEKAIFRTRDGGATWQAGAAAVFYPKTRVHGGLGTYGYPTGLAFARTGWGLLTESRGTLYVTRDGGTRFHAESKVVRPEIDFAGGASVFRSGVGYVLIGSKRLIKTSDFGRTWRVVRRWRR
jgi:photosystem II stability/assembly factor-like uncharacterized protein